MDQEAYPIDTVDHATFVKELYDLDQRLKTVIAAATQSKTKTVSKTKSEGLRWATEWRVRKIQELHSKRNSIFDAKLFADPNWEMFLELYVTHLARRQVSISSLCIASGVPSTTALRHIQDLLDEGWFVKEPDALDGRRYFVSLSQKGLTAMTRYFDEAARLGR